MKEIIGGILLACAQTNLIPVKCEARDDIGLVKKVTTERLMISARDNVSQPCDETVFAFSGYTRTGADFTGDFLRASYEGIKAEDPEGNACFEYINTNGRGTQAYEDNRNEIGGIRFQETQEDALAIVGQLLQEDPHLGAEKIVLVGHSLGAHTALEASEMLLKQGLNVSGIVLDAPAPNHPFPGVRVPFLMRIGKEIPGALAQVVRRNGYSALTEKRDARLMGADHSAHTMSVEDGGLIFTGFAFQIEKTARELYQRWTQGNGPDLVVVQHEDDHLLDKRMTSSYARQMERRGATVDVETVPGPHLIPREMEADGYTKYSKIMAKLFE